MKQYILGRVVRSIISIFAVVSIACALIYGLIPHEKIFNNDPTWKKIASDPVASITYKYQKWEDLGYVDFQNAGDICKLAGDSVNYNTCVRGTTDAFELVKAEWEAKGYTVMYKDDGTAYVKQGIDFYEEQPALCKLTETGANYEECVKTRNEDLEKAVASYIEEGYVLNYYNTGTLYAVRENSVPEIIFGYISNLVKVDTPWTINDASNPNLERKIYAGLDHNNIPALKCSGCENQYLIYLDGKFPFIHQNIVKLNFGISYPTYAGLSTMEVIGQGQGDPVKNEVNYDTGLTAKSAINLHSCKYKASSTISSDDAKKFATNYADCDTNKKDPSMIGTSYLFGILGIIVSYGIGLPAGILMAQKKDKWQDKLGIVYINVMIATPSLAFIFFMKMLGNKIGLPDKFPSLGFGSIKSYILPVIILGLLSTAGLMIWMRRYMVDQANSDYVKFARAKGLSQKEIFNRHILKNAIIPIVNGIPASIVLCISGAVITESVFAIPGMGKMLPDAINAANNNMIITLTFIFTSLSVISLLLGDLLMTLVDPRIQLSSKGDSR